MVDGMTQMKRSQPPSVALISTSSSSSVSEQLVKQMSATADEIAPWNNRLHALPAVTHPALIVLARDIKPPQPVDIITISAQRHIPSPDTWSGHVPQGVAGPLLPFNCHTHLLTRVDRYTRWTEAIPLLNVQAEAIVGAFTSRWVAIFGTPSTVMTDRGAHFESAYFRMLLRFLGCTRIRTTPYYSTACGMVERFHRQLMIALLAAEDPGNWSDKLSLALFGIRATVKSDLDCSAAELIPGIILRLPGELVAPTSHGADETPDNFV
nr:unnamed protein product [Spirometra erinaceieuropaei]